MPLIKGAKHGSKGFTKNIKEEAKTKPVNQSIAIAYSLAKEKKRKEKKKKRKRKNSLVAIDNSLIYILFITSSNDNLADSLQRYALS